MRRGLHTTCCQGQASLRGKQADKGEQYGKNLAHKNERLKTDTLSVPEKLHGY